MVTALVTRGITLLLLGLLMSGCANRGLFGDESCKSDVRVAVDSKAAYAIYLDKDGNPVGPPGVAEDLLGTRHNLMCPTPRSGESLDPGVCAPGYCPKVMLGKTYCLRC
jgi:hypothetical protein